MFFITVSAHRTPLTGRTWTAAALVIAFALLFAAPLTNTAHAASPGMQAAAINGPPLSPFGNVWNESIGNHQPAVAYNSRHGEYLVVWWNDRGAMRDIYARRVAADGKILGWFSVVSMKNKWNWLPDVAYNPQQDEYLIVYTRKETASDYNVYARRVKWNGSWIGADIPIRTVAGKQWYPAVAYNMIDNEFLVVYENYWSSTLRDIDAQRVRGYDGKLLSWRNIATASGTLRSLPAVAYNEARNEYLIAYTYMPNSVSTSEALAKIASASMNKLSVELKLAGGPFNQGDVALAAGPDEYMAVWVNDAPSGSYSSIYGRRVAGNGTLHPDIRIRDLNAVSNLEPAVSFSPFYGYVAVWRHASNSLSGNDIYARTIVPHTNEMGPVFELDKGSSSQRAPALVCAETGECLFADEDNVGGFYDIWVRRIVVERMFVPSVMK